MGKDKEPDLLMAALIFGGSIAVGLGAGYVLRPFIEDLLKPKTTQVNNPQPQSENENAKPKAENPSPPRRRLRPHYTMNKSGPPKLIEGVPIEKLRVRYSGS